MHDLNEIAIRCRGIRKAYGKNENRIEALRGIDLDIDYGHLTLLVGPSGSGKTTLLSVIATILTPDEGELYLLGKEIHQMTELEKAEFRRHHLGIVFQSLFLIPTLTIAENVALPLIVAGQNQKEAEEKAMSLLEKMHLAHRSHSSPSLLSKGQQQRVAIARAMANDSNVILCDEPTSALDHTMGAEVMSFLHDLAVKDSKAVLVVTHDHRIFSFAHRIINMDDGQITGYEHA
jgi:putative ABC transport system ATP-binding protein